MNGFPTAPPPVGAAVTPGLVCAHHHLYSTLARGMPAPPRRPEGFTDILEQIWWRLDAALDLDLLRHSALLGAVEALRSGCTAIIDHHESPGCIDGSLDVIADACAEVGVRVVCAYGVTDRWGDDGRLHTGSWPPPSPTRGAQQGLAECDRFLAAIDRAGSRSDAPGNVRGMVGVHAAFTCHDDTLAAAAELADRWGVGVHVHVAEGPIDADAGSRLAPLATDDWLVVHAVHLDTPLAGTVVHNPRSNMNNSVGYARPTRFANRVALGTDGIGADMLDEFRLAYARLRESDVTSSPDTAWSWLAAGWELVPEAASDRVRWDYPTAEPWHLAFTTGVRPQQVWVGDELVFDGGSCTRVDEAEIRSHAAEAASRLFARLR